MNKALFQFAGCDGTVDLMRRPITCGLTSVVTVSFFAVMKPLADSHDKRLLPRVTLASVSHSRNGERWSVPRFFFVFKLNAAR